MAEFGQFCCTQRGYTASFLLIYRIQNIQKDIAQIQYIQIINICQINSNFQTFHSTMKTGHLFWPTNSTVYTLEDISKSKRINQMFLNLSIAAESIFLFVFVLAFTLALYRTINNVSGLSCFSQNQVQQIQFQGNNNQNKEIQSSNSREGKQQLDKNLIKFDQEVIRQKNALDLIRKNTKQWPNENEEGKIKQQGQNIEILTETANMNKEKDKENYRIKKTEDKVEIFLNIESQFELLLPFLIPFIIINQAFATGVATIVILLVTLVVFLIFNFKRAFRHVRWLTILFIVPAMLGFSLIYI